MTVTLNPVPRFDTRGLPQGFDTETLFQYRYDTLASSAKGVESFLYKYIPVSLVKSFAFAIDPTYRYKISPGTITAANRRRVRSIASVLQARTFHVKRTIHSWSQESNYKGHSFCSSPYLVHATSVLADSTSAVTPQVTLIDEINDTTTRTRLFGSTQGELDFFKSTLNSPPRSFIRGNTYRRYSSGFEVDDACKAVGGTADYQIGSDDIETKTWGPYGATLSSPVYDALRASEIAFCKAYAQKEAISMLKGVSPFNRDYSLSRNVAELKDLPRSIVQAQATMADLRKLFTSLKSSPKVRDSIFDLSSNTARHIPSEYLSYHFGWKQTYRDLTDLLALPEKLSKRLNFLIARSGKETTFRVKRNSLSSVTGVSGFVYEENGNSWPQNQVSRIERESELRLVVSATFDFPPINTPSLRQRFFADKVGLIPRFIDVYNIIPYTWLIDWFTGLGNYLELIEEINHDPSLINWGVITSHTKGRLVTELEHISATYGVVVQNGVTVEDGWKNTSLHHTSVLDYECRTRQNVANVLDVKQTTIPTSLTGYQLSILGAILASRTDHTRAGAFRPRS